MWSYRVTLLVTGRLNVTCCRQMLLCLSLSCCETGRVSPRVFHLHFDTESFLNCLNRNLRTKKESKNIMARENCLLFLLMSLVFSYLSRKILLNQIILALTGIKEEDTLLFNHLSRVRLLKHWYHVAVNYRCLQLFSLAKNKEQRTAECAHSTQSCFAFLFFVLLIRFSSKNKYFALTHM